MTVQRLGPLWARRWQHTSALTSSTRSTPPAGPVVATSAVARPVAGDRVVQQLFSDYEAFRRRDGWPLGPRPGDEAILTLSGGVDSSVASYLAIHKAGLVPRRTVFMRNWNSLDERQSFEPGAGGATGCQWMRDWEFVQRMAAWLGVEAQLVDLSTPYWNNVFSPSLDQWQLGQTPNPDVLCNREIKFGELLRRLDAEEPAQAGTVEKLATKRRWLVTGHYAGVRYFFPSEQDRRAGALHGGLIRPLDRNKDQSFFLSGVSSVHLGRSHFPLANVNKQDVRHLARHLGMPTAESKESMGICFVGKRSKSSEESEADIAAGRRRPRDNFAPTQTGFAGFLNTYIDAEPGDIVTVDGKTVGRHAGLHTLTIGQGAKVAGAEQRYFVAAKDRQTNRVIVVPGADHHMLQCRSLRIAEFHPIFNGHANSDGGFSESSSAFVTRVTNPRSSLEAQIRHRQDPVRCKVEASSSSSSTCSNCSLSVTFEQPVSSVAEGQVCALYDGDECLGSGVISDVVTLASR